MLEQDFGLLDLYRPKFPLLPDIRVATAGSCFAQHIGRFLKVSNLTLVDVEPAPKRMPKTVRSKFGYGIFSARYGNIYTPRQLLQLLRDALEERVHEAAIWYGRERYFDALRLSCEPDGFSTREELEAHRKNHLRCVRHLFSNADVLVLTLGLTEAWSDQTTGIVFPVAPGVLAGRYRKEQHSFLNFSYAESRADLVAAIGLLRTWSPEIKIVLTVSPVPLAATASGQHVLQATVHSKSVLRAVAGDLATEDLMIDYFPSYEIITGSPFAGRFFNSDLRSVTTEGVNTVMKTFFSKHRALSCAGLDEAKAADNDFETSEQDDLICEEALLEGFATQ